jgi:hypothetical protein
MYADGEPGGTKKQSAYIGVSCGHFYIMRNGGTAALNIM